MARKSRNSRFGPSLALILAGASFVVAVPRTTVQAQPPAIEPSAAKPDSSADEGGTHWLKKFANIINGGVATSEHERNHESVLVAFGPAVRAPAQSAVRVWCDQRLVAMGTIVDPDGFIVTKASELAGSTICELHDGTRHPAVRMGVDRASDLALLKIRAQDLPATCWCEEAPPSVGGWVITPGLRDVPLAIGIVSVACHSVRGGVLGIQMTEDNAGPRITYVVPGSGAADAGLSRGDIITHANNKRVETSDDMVATTSNMLPNEQVKLAIIRLDQKKYVTATLGSVSDTLSSRRARFQDHLGSKLSKRRFLFPSAFEHDSVLVPNQCGGALTNLDGETIGINIARASRISSYAIPSRIARPIIESLIERASQQNAISQQTTVPVSAQGAGTDLPETAAKQY